MRSRRFMVSVITIKSDLKAIGKMYEYNATVLQVYDGDTITIEVDLGFKISQTIKVRLAGIDTPEVKGSERERGLMVRDWLRDKILGKEVCIKTYKDKTGKYGRYIAEVFYGGDCINALLLSIGYAKPY